MPSQPRDNFLPGRRPPLRDVNGSHDDEAVPTLGHIDGETVPDLGRIPREPRWRRSIGAARRGTSPRPRLRYLPFPLGSRSTTRQVNFRLSPAEHAQLVEVAHAYGVSPTRLARMLTIRGVKRVLEDG
jgi:hypothetical protein